LKKGSLLILLLFSYFVNAQYNDCGLDKKSIALAQLIIEDAKQLRSELICNKALSKAAHEKAKTMAKFNLISHTIDHVTANEFLKNNLIDLPANYHYFGNQVEAIQGGMETAQEAFDYFMSSRSHKEHVLGELEFYKNQKHIGVGFYRDLDTQYEYFWVVYITGLAKDNPKQSVTKTKYKIIFQNNKKPRQRKH